MQALAAMLLVFMVFALFIAVVAVIYPFKPFRTRRRALLICAFLLFGIGTLPAAMETQESPDDAGANSSATTGEPASNQTDNQEVVASSGTEAASKATEQVPEPIIDPKTLGENVAYVERLLADKKFMAARQALDHRFQGAANRSLPEYLDLMSRAVGGDLENQLTNFVNNDHDNIAGTISQFNGWMSKVNSGALKTHQSKIEDRISKYALSIPSDMLESNRDIYKFLLSINKNNELYTKKILRYESEIEKEKNSKN